MDKAERHTDTSFLCPVRIVHSRLSPVRHDFSYTQLLHRIELGDLKELEKRSRFWGHNRFKPFSLYDADYLRHGDAPLNQKVAALLIDLGYHEKVERITLVTTPRYFGIRIFNPVSFYYCRNEQEELRYFIAEINNTYSERFVYVVDCRNRQGKVVKDIQKKQFYVSPFFDLDYQYDFQFSDIDDKLDVRISLEREGKVAFMSRVWSSTPPLPVSSRSHGRALVFSPLSPLLTTPRIYWQAMQLLFRRRLPVVQKPNPTLPNTVRTEPYSVLDRLCTWFIRRAGKRLNRGVLTVVMPDGEKTVYGAPSENSSQGEKISAEIHIHSYKFFRRLVLSGGLGFGESYLEGEWTTPDLTAALKLFLNNWSAVDEQKLNIVKPFRRLHLLFHKLRKNTIEGSRKNISAHYDLSNDLFRLFLDPSMTYSCGYYSAVNDSLEQAQKNKISRVLNKAQIEPGDKVLEIGSGWGSLAIAAAERGSIVTSITVSEEQYKLAQERVAQAQLVDKVRFELRDYRTLGRKSDQVQFDKIVSVEMLEAVGHENLPAFFQACERVLKPDGVVVLQVITQPDQLYDDYRKRSDFIQKYVFPGSHLPSLTALSSAISKYSNLVIESVENIGPHYARTLREWRERFMSSREAVQGLGYDERFERLWNFYLSSCEALFATRWLNVLQLVLTRPNNSRLMAADRPILAEASFVSQSIAAQSETVNLTAPKECVLH